MSSTLQQLIEKELKPYVRKIDLHAHYPQEFLNACGQHHLFKKKDMSEQELRFHRVSLIEQTAEVCMTTAFNLWCQMAALTYLRDSENSFLKDEMLPLLENGQILGGTGLSNALKHYAGLEELHLHAEETDGGYLLSGSLPSISNLRDNHWFGIVAGTPTGEQILAFLPCHAESLSLKEKTSFLALNGSATYACQFNQVFIPQKWVISTEAGKYIQGIRPTFLLYQIPLGLGVIHASIQSMYKAQDKQHGANQYLPIQPAELEQAYLPLREKMSSLAKAADLGERWLEVVKLRLDVAYLTTKAVHADMLHQGGAGYLHYSDSARRLREGYFLASLTPTFSHLEKMLHSTAKQPEVLNNL